MRDERRGVRGFEGFIKGIDPIEHLRIRRRLFSNFIVSTILAAPVYSFSLVTSMSSHVSVGHRFRRTLALTRCRLASLALVAALMACRSPLQAQRLVQGDEIPTWPETVCARDAELHADYRLAVRCERQLLRRLDRTVFAPDLGWYTTYDAELNLTYDLLMVGQTGSALEIFARARSYPHKRYLFREDRVFAEGRYANALELLAARFATRGRTTIPISEIENGWADKVHDALELWLSGKKAAASSDVKKVVASDPDSDWALLAYAEMQFASGKREGACPEFEALAKRRDRLGFPLQGPNRVALELFTLCRR